MAEHEELVRWSFLVTTATNRPRPNASAAELELHALIDELIESGEYDDLFDYDQVHEWPSRLLALEHQVCDEAIARRNFDPRAVKLLTHEMLWSRYRFEPGVAGPAFEAYAAFRRAVARANQHSGLRQWGGEHNRITYFTAAEEVSPVVSVQLEIIAACHVVGLVVLDDGDRCLVAPTDTNELAYIDTPLEGMLTPELERDTLAISATYRDYWRSWVQSRSNYERNFSEWLPLELLPSDDARPLHDTRVNLANRRDP